MFPAVIGLEDPVDFDGIDPYAPINDIENIFDDDEDSLAPLPVDSERHVIPLDSKPQYQPMVPPRLMEFNSSAVQPAPFSSFKNEGNKGASNDILSSVLDELDDITSDLMPDDILAFSSDNELCGNISSGSFGNSSFSLPQQTQPIPSFQPHFTSSIPVSAPPSFRHLKPLSKQKARVVSDESACSFGGSDASELAKPKAVSETNSSSNGGEDTVKFRMYQEEKWQEKFNELILFKKIHGHCQVPHGYKPNPTLARWAKRQRYQYKLYQEKKPSTMTEQRISSLEEVGFVWDSHSALWQERYDELKAFVRANGHANVPSTYPPNPKLAIWVKCQRRQFKLLVAGQPSNMTQERVDMLNEMDFVWEIRRTGFL